MSIHPTRRIDRRTAEQLLRGHPVELTGGPELLADLLEAAAAPSRADELAGERAAVAAFRQAHLGHDAQPRRISMIKTAVAKLLTLKVAAAAIAATSLGGVALAAGTGTLPTTPGDDARTSHPSPSHATGKPATAAEDGKSDAASSSMYGLCHAYTAGAGSEHGKARESPAFTALVTAAGGKDKVTTYCTAVLAAGPGKSGSEPSGKASTAADAADTHPTGKPAEAPDARPDTTPTGKPSTAPDGRPDTVPTVPTVAPDSHPTGKPSEVPAH